MSITTSVRLTAAAVSVFSVVVLAQAASAAQKTSTLTQMTQAQRQIVLRVVLSDPRIREALGEGPRRVAISGVELDKAEAERYLSEESAPPPTRRVSVLILNPATNRSLRAIVALGERALLAGMTPVTPSTVPIVREDVDDAFALAKENAPVRRALGDYIGRYHVIEPGADRGGAFVVQALPLRSSDAHDPCHDHRCVDLIFRAQRSYLPIRVNVDLSKRTVIVEGAKR